MCTLCKCVFWRTIVKFLCYRFCSQATNISFWKHSNKIGEPKSKDFFIYLVIFFIYFFSLKQLNTIILSLYLCCSTDWAMRLALSSASLAETVAAVTTTTHRCVSGVWHVAVGVWGCGGVRGGVSRRLWTCVCVWVCMCIYQYV